MPQQGRVGSRAVVESRYAILPPEGIPASLNNPGEGPQ